MKRIDETAKVITHLAKESDRFNSGIFSEEEGIVFGLSCITKLLGDIAISLARITDSMEHPEDGATQQRVPGKE